MIITKIQLRWNDMDMLGHLYNGKYQSLFDLGLNAHILNRLGIDYREGVSEGLWPLKASATINFIKQVHFNYPLEVKTHIVSVGNKSFTYFQQLYRTDTNEIMADCRTIMVCYDIKSQHSVAVPESWRKCAENDSSTNNL